MNNLPFVSGKYIESHCDFKTLIGALTLGFADDSIYVPMRHHHDFLNPKEQTDSTLLLMPAFNPGKALGVKVVTVSPNNGTYDLPAIQGLYLYLDAHKGDVKAILDAKALTVKRTAAASALASSFLSRKDASSLLMIGTGALSSNLIKAHASVRPIKTVYVWGRNIKKAQALCHALQNEKFKCTPVSTIEEVIKGVAIISCATLSPIPLVYGKWLQDGQHIDLVGSYKKDTREADDEAIKKASVFVDTYQGGLKESGDILIPLTKGIISEKDVKADLFDLCRGAKKGRQSGTEITIFKSVGHALEDLVAASYFYNLFISK